jgi:FkbH-like protein
VTIDTWARSLDTLKYSDYVKNLRALEERRADARPLRVAILRSYTAETIAPVLRFRLLLEGFRPDLYFGGYDQYVQDIVDSGSGLYAFKPDVVLLLTRIEELLPDFVSAFGARAGADWRATIEAKARELAELVATVQRQAAAQVLVQNLVLSGDVFWGAYDAQTEGGQGYLVAEFNRLLARELAGSPGAFVWDFNRFVQNVGYEQLFDAKMWHYAKDPYRQSAYPRIVDDLMRYLSSALGKAKKCVAVDLDNTLWGGIVGEDGLEGIALGQSYPGNCYRALQQELLKLYHRGILLAINSKNNEADALEVIDKHPDMILRREHFASTQINWNDKASNLRAIAEDLNIGLDSIVMIDDNPAECEQIREQLPACEVVCLPDKPYLLAQAVRSLRGTENVRLTSEDRKKGAMYKEQVARKREQSQYTSLDEFLRSLAIEISIDPATSYSIPRIAQLTQKTNQMNTTTRRYTEAQVVDMVEGGRKSVFSVSARDKFGDSGIVGVFILDMAAPECRIDTFLLSCRVIGRNLEASMLRFIGDFARDNGATKLIGEFLPTAKNAPAAGMFPKLGFERRTETLFELDLTNGGVKAPDYIQVNQRQSREEKRQ